VKNWGIKKSLQKHQQMTIRSDFYLATDVALETIYAVIIGVIVLLHDLSMLCNCAPRLVFLMRTIYGRLGKNIS